MDHTTTDPNLPQPPPVTIPQKTHKLRNILFLASIMTIPIVIISTYFYLNNKLTSPIATTKRILGFNTIVNKPNKIVMGFLPYWNIKHANTIPYQLLTHLAVFGINVQEDGTFQKRELDYQEPGWRVLNSTDMNTTIRQAKSAGTKTILVLIGFDNDIIDSITSSPLHTQTLIEQTIAFVETKNYDGVNIDFEYVGQPSSQTINNFTSFVTTFSNQLKNHNPALEISIDVFADSSSTQRIWDLEKLAPVLDHIMVMAYDFHRPSSATAGPVAPLFGASDLWDKDISSLIAAHTKKYNPQQIILGVPYYGYEWQTTSDQHLSPTVSRTGSTATYKRIQEIINSNNPTLYWSPDSLTPWLTYEDQNNIFQIHYDNPKSLSLKYDLVNQSNLAGVGIWALGYEGTHTEIWKPIEIKFN